MKKRVLYTRPTGKRLTYEIEADEHGAFSISLDGVVLKRAIDQLVSRGLRPSGPKVLESTISNAKVAIDYLILMNEESPRNAEAVDASPEGPGGKRPRGSKPNGVRTDRA